MEITIKHGWFGGTPIFGNIHIGDYITQVYRDYNKPLYESLLTNQDSMESNQVFFRGSSVEEMEIPGSSRYVKFLPKVGRLSE